MDLDGGNGLDDGGDDLDSNDALLLVSSFAGMQRYRPKNQTLCFDFSEQHQGYTCVYFSTFHHIIILGTNFNDWRMEEERSPWAESKGRRRVRGPM